VTESKDITSEINAQIPSVAIDMHAVASLAAECIGLTTTLAILLGLLSLFPATVVGLVGPRGMSTLAVIWQFVLRAPIGIFWAVFFLLWIGGIQVQRGREWGRRLVDLAAWLMMIGPAMWLSRIWGEWFADTLCRHYNNLPDRRWQFISLGVAFLIGMMVAVSLKRRLWSDQVLATCGRAPAGNAPFTRITLFELVLILLASIGAGVLLGCWIGWRS
jgi:hypothetical protein